MGVLGNELCVLGVQCFSFLLGLGWLSLFASFGFLGLVCLLNLFGCLLGVFLGQQSDSCSLLLFCELVSGCLLDRFGLFLDSLQILVLLVNLYDIFVFLLLMFDLGVGLLDDGVVGRGRDGDVLVNLCDVIGALLLGFAHLSVTLGFSICNSGSLSLLGGLLLSDFLVLVMLDLCVL